MKSRSDQGAGINEYARHRAETGQPGKSRASVQKAIASGRLAASIVYVDGRPRIRDVEAADREWAASTKSDRVPLTNGDGASSALIAARTRRETALAEIAEMEAAKMRGEVVAKAAVLRDVTSIIVEARNSFLGLAAKLIARIPNLDRDDFAVIDGLVREVLEDLASGAARKKLTLTEGESR